MGFSLLKDEMTDNVRRFHDNMVAEAGYQPTRRSGIRESYFRPGHGRMFCGYLNRLSDCQNFLPSGKRVLMYRFLDSSVFFFFFRSLSLTNSPSPRLQNANTYNAVGNAYC